MKKHPISSRLTRLYAAALLLILMISAVSCSSQNVEVPDGMQLASSTDREYFFFVPTGWINNSMSGTSSAYYSLDDRTTVSVHVTSYSPTESSDIAGYWKSCEDEYKTEFKSYAFIGEEATTVSDRNAKAYTYSAEFSGETYRFRQVIFTHDNMFYSITYTALEDHFDAHLEDLALIQKEFRFR